MIPTPSYSYGRSTNSASFYYPITPRVNPGIYYPTTAIGNGYRDEIMRQWYESGHSPTPVEMAVNALTTKTRAHVFTRNEIGKIIQGLLRYAETMPDDPPRKDHDA